MSIGEVSRLGEMCVEYLYPNPPGPGARDAGDKGEGLHLRGSKEDDHEGDEECKG